MLLALWAEWILHHCPEWTQQAFFSFFLLFFFLSALLSIGAETAPLLCPGEKFSLIFLLIQNAVPLEDSEIEVHFQILPLAQTFYCLFSYICSPFIVGKGEFSGCVQGRQAFIPLVPIIGY